MPGSQVINIALIGIGTIGKRHLIAIDQVDDINISGIVDLSEQAQSFCHEKNIPLYKNLSDLKNKCDIDGVVISTPTVLHHENAITALKLGLDVLIEKPISATVSEAEEIAKIGNEHKCKILVGHQRRFYPLVMQAKNII